MPLFYCQYCHYHYNIRESSLWYCRRRRAILNRKISSEKSNSYYFNINIVAVVNSDYDYDGLIIIIIIGI